MGKYISSIKVKEIKMKNPYTSLNKNESKLRSQPKWSKDTLQEKEPNIPVEKKCNLTNNQRKAH